MNHAAVGKTTLFDQVLHDAVIFVRVNAQVRDALPAEIDRPAQQPVYLPVPGDAVDRAVGAAREPAPLLDRLIRRGRRR